MSFKKKDLEIVYNLRWKNGPKREDKNQIMSIVAVYDIPATTLNFEIFKSYLLKNSGTAEDDVSVIYIMDSGKEYPIKSQTDFQVALYDFRRKARVGEVINLLLERISDQPIHKNLRHSNDVETQSDNMEPNSILTTCSNMDIPPEWFISGLAQLKKDIKDEVSANVSSIVAGAIADLKSPNFNPPQQYALCPHHRIRNRYERRLRKITPHTTESVTDAKDLIKSLKLENKLEKLERKASKYREKRLALQNCHKSSDNGPKSSDSEAGPSTSRSRSRDKEEKRKREEHQKRKAEEHQKAKGEDLKMDARPVNAQTSVPHMLGGEIYLHQWEVQNTGQVQWTSKTQLQYTWGSKLLVPVEKTLSVPNLKPGETGTVTVRLHIPTVSGTYECYWQFTHKGRRFGHWLGVQVIVDSFDLKGHGSVLEKTEPVNLDGDFKRLSEEYEKLCSPDLDTPKKSDKAKSPEAQPSFVKALQFGKQTDKTANDLVKNGDELLREMCDDLGVLRLGRNASAEILAGNTELYEKLKSIAIEDEIDSDCSWSSEPTHFWSKIDEKGEYVVVPVPQCFVLDTPDSSDNNMDKKEETLSKEETLKKGNKPEPTQTTASKDQKAVDLTDNFDDNNNTESVSGTSGSSIKLRDEELDNIVVITVPKDEQVKEGFIYVHVDGQKVLIPKNILKSEVITAAQELERSPSASNSVGVVIDSSESLNKSPTPSIASTITGQNVNQASSRSSSLIDSKKDDDNLGNTLDSATSKKLAEPVVQCQYNLHDVAVDLSTGSREVPEGPLDDAIDRSNYFEANNYMSHCSAAGSCFSEVNSQAERQNRVFVFPEDVPGYEVVYPVLDVNSQGNPTLTTEYCVPQHQSTPCAVNPTYNIPQQVPNPFMEPIPNYQQTPVELRRAPVCPGTDPLMYGGVYPEPPNVYLGGGEPCVNIQRPVFEEEIQQPRAGGNQQPPQASAPQSPGRWVNGHWVSTSPETPREANLQALAEMGFWNRDLNATLLARFNDDLNRVVAELVQ